MDLPQTLVYGILVNMFLAQAEQFISIIMVSLEVVDGFMLL